MNANLQNRIVYRLRRRGRGKVFTPKDFLDVGGRDAVDKALSRLASAGTVQRLGRGLYVYPKRNKRLGIVIPPDVDDIADAVARQTGSRVVPSGATAANALGLSTQVPAKPVYLTDGRSRRVRGITFVITLKHASPKEMPIGRPTSAAVLQALRHLGKDSVDAAVLGKIRRALTPRHRSQLLHDARYTTDWMADAVREIASSEVEAIQYG
jgi:hypothetical protein